MWYVSFDNLNEGRILDFMTERIRQEGRGGEALWTTPTKERKPPRKLEKNRLCLVAGHEGMKDTKGRRSWREEGHEGRKYMKGGREDTKGGRTQREGGGGEALWTAPTKVRKSPSK